MKLEIHTIVLDGEPFIERHLDVFTKLKIPWTWRIAEGAAQNTHCTSWCQPQSPRLSNDGTSAYLDSISEHPNVNLYRKELWDGKVDMFNTMMSDITEPSILLIVDSDELWNVEQLEKIMLIFGLDPTLDAMQFSCRYFVGENLVLDGNQCYGDYDYEWWRTWRVFPGCTWISHEPPKLNTSLNRVMLKPQTRYLIGTFSHFAYATEAQVKYKEQFYSYPGLLEGWRRLQKQETFPVYLKHFFPHVHDDAMVNRI